MGFTTTTTGSIAGITEQFQMNARPTLPHKEMKAAEHFVTYVTSMQEAGMQVSDQVIKDGRYLHQTLTDKGLLYEHAASTYVGKTVTCHQEFNNQIEEIGNGLNHVQVISDRVNNLLKTMNVSMA